MKERIHNAITNRLIVIEPKHGLTSLSIQSLTGGEENEVLLNSWQVRELCKKLQAIDHFNNYDPPYKEGNPDGPVLYPKG